MHSPAYARGFSFALCARCFLAAGTQDRGVVWPERIAPHAVAAAVWAEARDRRRKDVEIAANKSQHMTRSIRRYSDREATFSNDMQRASEAALRTA
jgi:hypothetical protein